MRLTEEADRRGEALDGIFAYGVATDGAGVVLVRVDSGAPPLGQTFESARFGPMVATEEVPLFGDWDFRTHTSFSDAVPEGFRALFRICSNPQLLGSSCALARLRVRLTSAGATRDETLELVERLGCGGSSDVHACDTADHRNCVLKVGRVATAFVVKGFEIERKAPLAMQGAAASGLVPECVASGVRLSTGLLPYIDTLSVSTGPRAAVAPARHASCLVGQIEG